MLSGRSLCAAAPPLKKAAPCLKLARAGRIDGRGAAH